MTATAAKALSASHHPEDASATVGTSSGRPSSKRESDADYAGVICQLDDRTRIVECKDGIQWILQVRYAARWRNCSYHLSRDVLIERSGATGAPLAILLALPERHP